MKLRISTFKKNGKLKWNLRNFIHCLRTKIYTDDLQNKVLPSLWAFRVFAGTSFMALRIPVVSMDFSSLPSSTLQLLDDNCWCRPSFSSSLKNFRLAVYARRAVDFLPFLGYSIFISSNRTNVSFADVRNRQHLSLLMRFPGTFTYSCFYIFNNLYLWYYFHFIFEYLYTYDSIG
jgi:hypothetical protein